MNNGCIRRFCHYIQNLGVLINIITSNTYLLGKDVVNIGLEKGILKRSWQFSWIDLTDRRLDRKYYLLDGTVVYDQDIGTAIQRVEYKMLGGWYTFLVMSRLPF
jgi:arginyl-tRNA synthetase